MQKAAGKNMNYQNMFSLKGKGIVVTGGAGYLGSKIAECFQDFGASVIIAGYGGGESSAFRGFKTERRTLLYQM